VSVSLFFVRFFRGVTMHVCGITGLLLFGGLALIGYTSIIELNVFHPEVLSKVILGYYM